jgi:hypothetical protein
MNDLVQQEAISTSQPTVMQILASAVLKEGLDVGVVERLTALHLQLMDRDARIEFAESFARFKAKIPVIVRDAKIVVKDEIRSKYAKLDQIAEKVFPALLDEGITHRWKCHTAEDGRTFVTCFLRKGAYEEEGATLAAAADMSGSKNAIQGQGSTVSYLERYTFVASCGIVIQDQDDDGSGLSREGLAVYEKQIADCATMKDLAAVWTQTIAPLILLSNKATKEFLTGAKEAKKKELANA